MTENYLSIGEAAMISRLSKIQIWMLLRNHIIKAKCIELQPKINIDELKSLLEGNIYKNYQLTLPLQYREQEFSMKECIKELKEYKKELSYENSKKM